ADPGQIDGKLRSARLVNAVQLLQVLYNALKAEAHEPPVILRLMGIQGDVYETKVRHRTKAVDVALAQRCSIREVADQRSGKFAPGELKDRIHTAVKHGFIYARRYEEFGMDIRRRYFVNNFIDYARVKLLADPVRRGIWAEFANCVAFDISLYRE